MDNFLEKCFICAEETSEHFRNLMQLATKYSGTLVYKMIERFLEGDLSENAANLIASVICHECVVKLNDYDAAYTKAIIIQKEFTDLLRKNFIIVGDKIKLGEEMFFKEEADDVSYLEDLVELDQIPGEEPTEEAVQETKSLLSEKPVSMKCNACGISFQSLNEMKQHSHKTLAASAVDTFRMELLNDSDDFNLDDVEYIDEERLDDEREKSSEEDAVQDRVSDDEVNFEQLDELEEEEEHGEVEALEHLHKNPFQIRQTKCKVCNVELGSKTKLKNHMKEHHPPEPGNNAYACDICGLTVKTKSALSSHVAKHSRASNFDCTFCGKKFQQKGALARHVPIHTGERPYQCDKCGKQFIHYSSFHMHQLAHGNIREKKCEICGFMLRSSSHLKRHMRVHSGEKPFECPTCGQKFAQRYNMMTHLKAHQGIYREYSKVYKCPFCVETFQRKLKLQEHLTREHNTVVDSGLLKPIERPKKSIPHIEIVDFITACDDEDKFIGLE